MSDEDPFEGMETVGNLPPAPTDDFKLAVENAKGPKKQPNSNVIRGIKKQSVLAFVQYLKDNCASKIDSELNVSFEPMTYAELDRAAERFFER